MCRSHTEVPLSLCPPPFLSLSRSSGEDLERKDLAWDAAGHSRTSRLRCFRDTARREAAAAETHVSDMYWVATPAPVLRGTNSNGTPWTPRPEPGEAARQAGALRQREARCQQPRRRRAGPLRSQSDPF